MDFPVTSPVRYADETARPWPRLAIAAAAIAGLELVALLVIALAFIAKPFADDAASKAQAEQAKPAGQLEPRTETQVLVLNGNGRAGAAATAAKQVRRLEYPVVGVADASRRNFERTIVMYRQDARPEAVRLARDLGLPAKRAVPLDGMRAKDLLGADLAIILGRKS